jgi:pimeloyl-ACP methyl ester carboxylesterase
VLYFFHGAGGNERQTPAWTDGKFTTIAISWGRVWFLKDDKLDAFVHEIIPALEPSNIGRRVVYGGSMGGFNAYLAWSQAPELFVAAAFVCPAFVTSSPFDKHARYLRHGAEWYAKVLRQHFADDAEWKSYQPSHLRDDVRFSPAYMVWNRDDDFEFGGAPKLPAIHEARPGGHCEGVDTPGVRSFLTGH